MCGDKYRYATIIASHHPETIQIEIATMLGETMCELQLTPEALNQIQLGQHTSCRALLSRPGEQESSSQFAILWDSIVTNPFPDCSLPLQDFPTIVEQLLAMKLPFTFSSSPASGNIILAVTDPTN